MQCSSVFFYVSFFFFNDTATTEIYTLSLHDALPISRHTPVVGGEEGYPDLIAYPDLSTMTLVPWEEGLACCVADLYPVGEHPPPADPRGAVRRVVAGFEELGFAPVVGPELEFFLCERDTESPNGVRRYVDNL